jgi:hypothetical protein
MSRYLTLLAGLATLFAGPVLSQGTTPDTSASSGQTAKPAQSRGTGASRLWFDPMQLPSFTGAVGRYLINPEGETDRLIFRQGPQVIFPPNEAAAIEREIAPGSSIVVWGIRARRAPVITMLAWAKDNETPPHFVDRPTWAFPEFRAAEEPLEVAGEIRAPLYSPQGDVIGAILDEGTVVRVPPGVAAALGDRLNVGRHLAASGRGASVENKGRALDADRIGESREKLEPLPAPVERPQ